MNNGYPEENDIELLVNFYGTPLEFVQELRSLLKATGYASSNVSRENGAFHTGWLLKVATGGWSGCEEIMSAVQGTMFHFLFWSEISRGGGFTYRIPYALAKSEMELGALEVPVGP